MSLTQCRGCGSHIDSYASRCRWCGRQALRYQILQVGFGAALLGAIAMVAPASARRDLIRVLSGNGDEPLVTGFNFTIPASTTSASINLPAAGDDAASIAKRLERLREKVRPREPVRRREQARPSSRTRALPCAADSIRLTQLVTEHGEWDDQVLIAVACGQIRRGLTPEQVMAALGPPRRVVATHRLPGVERWLYPNRQVVLERGRVVGLSR